MPNALSASTCSNNPENFLKAKHLTRLPKGDTTRPRPASPSSSDNEVPVQATRGLPLPGQPTDGHTDTTYRPALPQLRHLKQGLS